jgi:hypothetical protein
MYVMAGLLVVGFICNYFVTAVHERYHMKRREAGAETETETGAATA